MILGRYDDAEKAARAGIDADPRVTSPRLRKLMGELLFRKRSYVSALESYQTYLKEAPDAEDAASVQQRVQVCQRMVKATANCFPSRKDADRPRNPSLQSWLRA